MNVFELDYTSIGEFRTSLKGIETLYGISTKFLVREMGFIILQTFLVISSVRNHLYYRTFLKRLQSTFVMTEQSPRHLCQNL